MELVLIPVTGVARAADFGAEIQGMTDSPMDHISRVMGVVTVLALSITVVLGFALSLADHRDQHRKGVIAPEVE